MLATLRAAWDRLFFAEGSAVSLAAFRILFALALLIELPISWSRNVAAVSSAAFHLPYVEALPLIPGGLYDALHLAQLPLILALGAGVWTRSACVALLALQGWIFFADALNFRNHPYLFLWVLLLLSLSPAGEALALRAVRRGIDAWLGPSRRPLTVQRLLQIQVCLVYLFAGLHKLHAYYFTGEVIAIHQRELEPLRRQLLEGLLEPGTLAALQAFLGAPGSWVVPAYLTVAAELGIPLALWIPRARVAAMAVGVGFHLAIAVTLGIYEFSLVMIASYLLFLDPDTLPRRIRALQSRKAQSRRRLAASSRAASGIA